jgi:hypothetical protein
MLRIESGLVYRPYRHLVLIKPDKFEITSSLPTDRALKALDELPRWSARGGLQGRRHGKRLTLSLDEPRRGLVLPVLRAELDDGGKHLVLRGEVRVMRVALLPSVVPLMFFVGAFFGDGGGQFALWGLAVASAAALGAMARSESRDFETLSTELRRRLAQVLTTGKARP